LSSHPGKTRTAGWQLSALAMIFALFTPILIRSFSIPEIVDWEMPVSFAISAWLSS